MKKTSGNHLPAHSNALVLAADCLAAIEGGAEKEQEGGQVEVHGGTPVRLEDSNNLTADNTTNHYRGSQVTNFNVHGNPRTVYQGNTFNTYNSNYYSC
jgi:hypothetical protein